MKNNTTPCRACGKPNPKRLGDEYCSTCLEEINAWHDSQPEITPAELDDWASQYDDDPNPYAGTYSEM
jgi:hypothetical protein